MPITHAFVSGIADDPAAQAAGQVLPSHWNQEHDLALTTAEVAASADKNYVTDAQAVVIGNTSGTNTGDQTIAPLVLEDANTVAQRNSTNPQSFFAYNTYTNVSNYERGFVRWDTDVLEFGAEAAGTGVARAISFSGTGVGIATPGGTTYFSSVGVQLQVGTTPGTADATISAGRFRADPSAVALGSLSSRAGTLLGSGSGAWWSSTADWYDTVDTGIKRNAAGVAEVNTGTAGTFGDLKVKTLAATGSANVLSVDGSAATAPVTLTATGTDADIDVNIVTKGAGVLKVNGSAVGASGEAFPVGSVFISVVSTNPGTLLGYGTWSGFGAGRVMVGLDSGDGNFDTVEETGGAKTVAAAGTVAAPTISGSTAAEATHTHSVTSNVTVANHASHTHQYTQVPNHVHVQSVGTAATGALAGYTYDASTNTSVASGYSTANPTGGVATGTTVGPDATMTHTPTNNAVTSGAGASHLHDAGTLAASAPAFTGSATSVVQPYIVCYFWKRTA